MKKTENDRGKSQVWRNSTTTTTASSVAFPQTVCVCAFPSAHQSAGEREKVREKTSRFIQLEWACSCALHRLMISPLPPRTSTLCSPWLRSANLSDREDFPCR